MGCTSTPSTCKLSGNDDGIGTPVNEDIDRLFRQWVTEAANAPEARDLAYQQLENAGLINRVVVHRYIGVCGCPLATVIRVGGHLLCRTRDNKQSHGLNARSSVESARSKRTLDGDRHWPRMTIDVGEHDVPGAFIEMHCRHHRRNVAASDIMAAAKDVLPGHPRAPTRL